jgi:dnd system-associated protein 4
MSDIEMQRSDRVVIDESVIDIYKELYDSPNLEDKPFRTLKEVFMIAACLGYRSGHRQKLTGSSKHTIRKEVFSDDDLRILKAIAIATTGDVEVLLRLSDVFTIVEEYAQAGIYEIQAQLLDHPGRPLWNLVDLVSSSSNS